MGSESKRCKNVHNRFSQKDGTITIDSFANGAENTSAAGTEQHKQTYEAADISIVIGCGSIGKAFDINFKLERYKFDLVLYSERFTDDCTHDKC